MVTCIYEKLKSSERGQALVEFALIVSVLLAFIFIVIESGRVFQAWLTVQSAARNGARYAVTGQYNDTGVFNTPECPAGTPTDRWQVCSVKDESLRTASGLNIDPTAAVGDPNAFGTQVCIPDNCPPENVGLPGEPTRVRVFYNVEIITPFLRPIASFIRVTGQVEVVTENYDQVSPNEIIITDVVSGGETPPLPNVADIRISKSDSIDPVYVQETFVYSLTVVNDGPFDTPSVQIVDILPSATISVTDISITDGTNPIVGAVCSLDPLAWQIDCVIPFLEGGGAGTNNTAVINITTQVDPVELRADPSLPNFTVTNEASVFNAIATTDPDLSNNSTTEDTTVKPWADLELIKSHQILPPIGGFVLGEPVVYEILVQNFGPNTAQGATVTDVLPAGLVFESVTDTDANCVQAGNGISCPLSDLPENTTASIQLTARAVQSNTIATQTNTAVVSAPSNPEERNDVISGWHAIGTNDNQDSVNSTVSAPALILTKTKLDPGPGIVDEIMRYSISIFNEGPGLARGVVFTDTFYNDPNTGSLEVDYSGTFLDGEPAPCLYEFPNDYFICTLGDIPNKGLITIEARVTPKVDKPDMPNSVLATSNGDLIQASTTITTPVVRLYDLEVVKTGPDTIDINSEDSTIKYTVVITNHGPSSTGPNPLTVQDTLAIYPGDPMMIGSLSVVEDMENISCTVAGDKMSVDCKVTDLLSVPKSNFTTFDLEITPSRAGIITNTVTAVDTVSGDADNYPDSASVSTEVLPYADLTITKEVVSQTTGLVQYGISVTNNGPSQAKALVISDTVTVGTITGITMTYQTVCDSAKGGSAPVSVGCRLDALNPNATANFTVTVVFSDTVGETLRNDVRVSSSTFDPQPGNNYDSVTNNNLISMTGLLITNKQSLFVAHLLPGVGLKNRF